MLCEMILINYFFPRSTRRLHRVKSLRWRRRKFTNSIPTPTQVTVVWDKNGEKVQQHGEKKKEILKPLCSLLKINGFRPIHQAFHSFNVEISFTVSLMPLFARRVLKFMKRHQSKVFIHSVTKDKDENTLIILRAVPTSSWRKQWQTFPSQSLVEISKHEFIIRKKNGKSSFLCI